ncbi:MAG TPA: DMT family transporter [Coriobacteriia bacterium]|nr:DMT family transporter [Coriobacteriia bacterium]
MTDPHAWRRDPLIWVAIIASLLLWASAFAGIRASLDSYGPGQVALLRFATASLLFLAWALITRMRMPRAADLPRIALAGLSGITAYHVALNFGQLTVTAGAASLIVSASPILTALLSALFLGERLSASGWTGIAVSFAGVALISLGEGGGIAFDPGAALVAVAAVATSVYLVVSKRPLRRYTALEFTSYAIWAGTVPLLIFAPDLLNQVRDASPSATAAVIYLGVFPGAVAYALWSYALARMPASSLSTFLYFQPVSAIVIAWLWLAEVPAPLALAGGAISLAGVAVVNTRGMRAGLGRSRPAPDSPPEEERHT